MAGRHDPQEVSGIVAEDIGQGNGIRIISLSPTSSLSGLSDSDPVQQVPGVSCGPQECEGASDVGPFDRPDLGKRRSSSPGHRPPKVQEPRSGLLGAGEPSRADPLRRRCQSSVPVGVEGEPTGNNGRAETTTKDMGPKETLGELGTGASTRKRRSTGWREQGREAPCESDVEGGQERQGKRQRTKREVQMVRMPSGAKGVDVASLERALNCHEFDSGVGEKVARAVRVLVLHPQVIQLYDELRTMVESPRLWQEVEMKFFTELIEVSHLGLDEAVEQLLRVFRLAIGDQLPGESPFFQSLGVPKVPLEPSPGVRSGPLRDTVEGIEIRELVDGWVRDDGGVYVGKGVGSWPCSPFQESYSSDLKPELVRVALNRRPLYVGRDEVGNAKEVIRRFGLSSGSCLTHLQWREGYQKLFRCPVPLSYTGVALKMGASPWLIGKLSSSFPLLRFEDFSGKTGELLPVRLALETPEEIEAMELMKKVFAGRIDHLSVR